MARGDAVNFIKQLLATNAGNDAIVRVINQLQTQLQELFGMTAIVPTKLTGVALIAGRVNLVRTGLGSPVVGYSLTRVRGQATIWDTQDTNTTPGYLALWTSSGVSVDLEVF